MSAICDAHKKTVGVELLYNSVHRKFNQLETRCGRESQHQAEGAFSCSWESDHLDIRCGRSHQHPERLGPQDSGWATQENWKEMRLCPIEWGSICCSSVRSPTPSHTQPFQISERYIFLRTVSLVFIEFWLWFSMHTDVYVLGGYTTKIVICRYNFSFTTDYY